MKKFYKKHKRLVWIFGVILVLLILSYVGSVILVKMTANDMAKVDRGASSLGMEAPIAAPAVEESVYGERSEVVQTAAGDETIDQKIIKTGALDLVVKKVGQAVSKITDIVEQKGGFVSDSNIYTREDKTQYGTVTVRVPFEHFGTTMTAIKDVAETVEEESVSGLDVTEQFVDLQSRLENLRIEEEQYQKILKTAEKVEDVLKVTQRLFDVREDIERIEGRIKYLENLTDLSTIRINLSEEPLLEVPTAEWKPLTTLKKAFRSMIKFWQGLFNVLIWLAFYVIPLGIVVFAIYKLVKFIRRRHKEKKKKWIIF
jgi:hypothetical protein